MGQEIEKALAAFDAAKASCPFNQLNRRPIATSKPCPKCRATSAEPCGPLTSQAFNVVAAVRQHLLAEKGK